MVCLSNLPPPSAALLLHYVGLMLISQLSLRVGCHTDLWLQICSSLKVEKQCFWGFHFQNAHLFPIMDPKHCIIHWFELKFCLLMFTMISHLFGWLHDPIWSEPLLPPHTFGHLDWRFSSRLHLMDNSVWRAHHPFTGESVVYHGISCYLAFSWLVDANARAKASTTKLI